MKLSQILGGLFSRPLAATDHQTTIQARVVAHLVKHGVIDARTVLHMGTTDAHKMFTRLRRQGYLFRADNPRGHFLVPNHSGSGKYRVHYWTGKRPERRAKVRGGRS